MAAAPAVPERNGYRPLGTFLAYDIFIQFLDDLSWCLFIHDAIPLVQFLYLDIMVRIDTDIRRD